MEAIFIINALCGIFGVSARDLSDVLKKQKKQLQKNDTILDNILARENYFNSHVLTVFVKTEGYSMRVDISKATASSSGWIF